MPKRSSALLAFAHQDEAGMSAEETASIRPEKRPAEPASNDGDPKPAERGHTENGSWLGVLALSIPSIGLLGLAIYCLTLASKPAWAAAGSGIAVAGAATSVGGLFGFLFGIPRSLQGDQTTSNGSDAPGGYRPNTNLEQMSDWLTKILVGVGLVELGNAGAPARRLVHSVGEALGDTPTARVVAASVMLLFVVWGFLLSYLLTRTRVASAFRQSELEVITRRAARLASGDVQERLNEQAIRDAAALSLVERVLNPPPGTPTVTQEELNAAMLAASPSVRVQVFHRARQLRQATWQNSKDRMAMTIPAFRALVASDVDGKYHRGHAQLAYALKDQTHPDWAAAEQELSAAITIRGPSSTGWLLYEFNRALCRIQLDPGTLPSSPEARDAILGDMQQASRSPHLMRLLQQEPVVVSWLSRNSLGVEDISP
jgi:hypothetical protein